jgi:hypothetical protein
MDSSKINAQAKAFAAKVVAEVGLSEDDAVVLTQVIEAEARDMLVNVILAMSSGMTAAVTPQKQKKKTAGSNMHVWAYIKKGDAAPEEFKKLFPVTVTRNTDTLRQDAYEGVEGTYDTPAAALEKLSKQLKLSALRVAAALCSDSAFKAGFKAMEEGLGIC